MEEKGHLPVRRYEIDHVLIQYSDELIQFIA